jgi:hypothetical protein
MSCNQLRAKERQGVVRGLIAGSWGEYWAGRFLSQGWMNIGAERAVENVESTNTTTDMGRLGKVGAMAGCAQQRLRIL